MGGDAKLHYHGWLRLRGALDPSGNRPLARAGGEQPFGIFIRTPDVDAIAARVDDLIIRPGGLLRHREWSLYDVGICGPDGLLVRIGWPSRLMRG
jgi:hypothetical protein